MQKSVWALGLLIGLTAVPASANIIDVTADADGDGAVDCQTIWNPDTASLSLTCVQHWAPGHVMGSITTDTELDPTLWIVNSVENDMGASWAGYHLGISMNKSFSIVGIVAPPDWTWAITPPSQVGSIWMGGIDFSAGTPIGINGQGNFGSVLSFLGSATFTQEMIPTAIPEPSSLAVSILFGAALFARRLRRRA